MKKMKPFWHSKIIWVASIPMIVELINLSVTQPFIPQQYQGVLTFIGGALTIYYRFRSGGEKLGTKTITNDTSTQS